jgi:hypothetical protein
MANCHSLPLYPYKAMYRLATLGLTQRLQLWNQPLSSDIDRYFDSPRLEVTDTKGPNQLFNWWRVHREGLFSNPSI